MLLLYRDIYSAKAREYNVRIYGGGASLSDSLIIGAHQPHPVTKPLCDKWIVYLTNKLTRLKMPRVLRAMLTNFLTKCTLDNEVRKHTQRYSRKLTQLAANPEVCNRNVYCKKHADPSMPYIYHYERILIDTPRTELHLQCIQSPLCNTNPET